MHNIKILHASKYISNEPEMFSYIISKAYEITKTINCDYKNRSIWYWKKVVPDVVKGTRDVLLAILNNNTVGVSILKKQDAERKICTLFILNEYRNMGVATALLEDSFKFLQTTKPLFTVAEYKLEQFIPIIKKYGWQKTQVLEKGYYNDLSREIVFNGKIS